MPGSYKIAPSILAADFTRLGEQVREAESGGADLFHCDVMDGHFVPNISFGPMIVAAVRKVTALPLDVHLMIEQPERYLEMTAKAGAQMINVHVETCPKLHDTIRQIRALGVKPGVAINPETPFERIQQKSTRLNSSHQIISYAVFCLKKKISRPLSSRTPPPLPPTLLLPATLTSKP